MPKKIIQIVAIVLCFLLFCEQSGFAQVAGSTTLTTSGQLDISARLNSFHSSIFPDTFRPLHLRYLAYDNLNNNFKVLLDKGDQLKNKSKKDLTPELKSTTKELLNYFFIGLSLPNDSFWVNLRPDSPDNVIDPLLAQTDIGRVMLEADVQLKKDTAKFTSPETTEGKLYWDKLYQKAGELYGSQNITIPTLTRPWIVPNEIIIRETTDNAYIYKATLKVMLEEDYLSQGKGISAGIDYSFKDSRSKELNEYSSQLLRELVIPKLAKEVNNAKRYAALRQVYYSLILAQWFKQRFQGLSPLKLSQSDLKGTVTALINSHNLTGLTSKTAWDKDNYFKQYQQSFKDGEYNLKEPAYTVYGQSIRSYFSGGMQLGITVPAPGQSNIMVTSIQGNPLRPGPSEGIGVEMQGADPENISIATENIPDEAISPQLAPATLVLDGAEFLGSGGEGAVYKHPADPGKAVKIFTRNHFGTHHWMVNNLRDWHIEAVKKFYQALKADEKLRDSVIDMDFIRVQYAGQQTWGIVMPLLGGPDLQNLIDFSSSDDPELAEAVKGKNYITVVGEAVRVTRGINKISQAMFGGHLVADDRHGLAGDELTFHNFKLVKIGADKYRPVMFDPFVLARIVLAVAGENLRVGLEDAPPEFKKTLEALFAEAKGKLLLAEVDNRLRQAGIKVTPASLFAELANTLLEKGLLNIRPAGIAARTANALGLLLPFVRLAGPISLSLATPVIVTKQIPLNDQGRFKVTQKTISKEIASIKVGYAALLPGVKGRLAERDFIQAISRQIENNNLSLKNIPEEAPQVGEAPASPVMVNDADLSAVVMQENISKGALEARHIYPLPSVGDPAIEEKIRGYIARIVNEGSVHGILDVRRAFDLMIGEFVVQGIHLSQRLNANVEDEFRVAIEKAFIYKEGFPVEEAWLQKEQDKNRFLALNHSLVVELQGYLDKMADPHLPRARLFVAIDSFELPGEQGGGSSAYSIGQSIVINLKLINECRTVDEVVAVLAHEQAHHEEGCKQNWQVIINRPDSGFKKLARGAMEEVSADLVGAKLAKVGLNIFALSEFFSREGSQGRDAVHLNCATRSAYALAVGSLTDYEAGYDFRNINIPIPESWRIKKVGPSFYNRIFLMSYSRDFKKALAEAPLQLLINARKAYSDSRGFERKKLAVFDEYIRRIRDVEECRDLSPRQKEAVSLLLLKSYDKMGIVDVLLNCLVWAMMVEQNDFTVWIESISRFGLFKSGPPPNPLSEIIAAFILNRRLKEMIISVAQNLPSQREFFKSLAGRTILGKNITQQELDLLADYISASLIGDDGMAAKVFGEACSKRNKSYLIQHARYLQQLSLLMDEEKRQEWLEDKLAMVIVYYGKAYGLRQNKGRFLEQLREANQYYQESLNINPKRMYKGLNKLWSFYGKYLPFTYEQLMYELFNHQVKVAAVDTGLPELIEALEKKDAALFFAQIKEYKSYDDRQYPFQRVLYDLDLIKKPGIARMIIRYPFILNYESFYNARLAVGLSYVHKDDLPLILKIKMIFEDDSALSQWILSLVESSWQNGQLEDDARMQQLIAGLNMIKNLPVTTAQERWEMIERYLGSQRAQEFFESLPTEELERLQWNSLYGIYRYNIKANPNGAGVSTSYYDLLLSLPIYKILKARRLSQIQNTQSLSEARQAFEAIVGYSSGVYGIPYRIIRLLALSEEHGKWLLPVYQAFVKHLENKLKFPSGEPQETIELYSILNSILTPGEEKERILAGYARKLIDGLPDEDLKAFLLNLIENFCLGRDLYDYFIEKRVRTKEQFGYFKEIMKQYIAIIMGGREGIGVAVRADKVIDDYSLYSMAKNLFTSMMDSRNKDAKLKGYLAFPWFLHLLSLAMPLGYGIAYINGALKVVGEGRNNFISFEEFVDSIYGLPEAGKLAMLAKLLVGPAGLLNRNNGKRVFADILGKQIAETGEFSSLLTDILRASAKELGPADLFLAFRQPTLAMFLKRPEQPGRQNFSGLARQMYKGHLEQLNRLTWGDTERYPFYEKKLLTPRHFKKFLQEYSRKIRNFSSGSEIGQLIELFAGKVKEKLRNYYERYRPKQDAPVGVTSLRSIDIVIEACQSVGPVGVRFLQILGQYMPVSEADQERFRDIYDTSERQDRFMAFQTLLGAIHEEEGRKVNPLLKRYVEEDLVSIDRRIGGGAIVTVFETTVRNRDANGNLIGGTHREVLKIRNPNAEAFTRRVVNAGQAVIKELRRLQIGNLWRFWRNRKNYEIAERLLRDIGEWVLQDINDDTFMELDTRYQKVHENYSASNGIAVRVPLAFEPNNKDIKREAFVPGLTLNKILKLKFSGRPIAQLIQEEQDKEKESPGQGDPQVEAFLREVQRQNLSLEEVFAQATQAIIEDFARHLVEPAYINEAGEEVYIIHSDMHFGNVIVSPDIKTVYPIDRNLYLQLDNSDAELVRKIVTMKNGDELLNSIVKYFLGLPENGDNPINKGSNFQRNWLMLQIGRKIKMSNDKSPLSAMMIILRRLESRNIKIPLKMRIMFKNLISVNAMLRDAKAGEFDDYVNNAVKLAHSRIAASESANAFNSSFIPLIQPGVGGFGEIIGNGCIFSATASAENIVVVLQEEGVALPAGIEKTIRIIQKYFKKITKIASAQKRDISECKIEFRRNVKHYAEFQNGKIIIDVVLLQLNVKDLVPFLTFILGHEGSHHNGIVGNDEAKAQAMDIQRFMKWSAANQQTVLNVLIQLGADKEYVDKLCAEAKPMINSARIAPKAKSDVEKVKEVVRKAIIRFNPKILGQCGEATNWIKKALTIQGFKVERRQVFIPCDTIQSVNLGKITIVHNILEAIIDGKIYIIDTQLQQFTLLDRNKLLFPDGFILRNIHPALEYYKVVSAFNDIACSDRIENARIEDKNVDKINSIIGADSLIPYYTVKMGKITLLFDKQDNIISMQMNGNYVDGTKINSESAAYYIQLGKDLRQKAEAAGSQEFSDQNATITFNSIVREGGNKGGIDFRSLPIVTQATTTLAGSNLRTPLMNKAGLAGIDDTELQEIKKLISAGTIPSTARVKDYISECLKKDDPAQDINKVLSCLASILRLEEERCAATEPQMKQILALLESDKTPAQMKLALAKIEVASSELEFAAN